MTTRTWSRGSQCAGSEVGAAAVEFALVSAIFFLLVFGIVQYGLYFNDSIQVRQVVREAARQAVVQNFPTCGSAANNLDTLLCNVRTGIGGTAGTTAFAKVSFASPWTKGNPVTVCAVLKSSAGFGLVPVPSQGYVGSMTVMSIEQDSTAPTGGTTTSGVTTDQDSLPTGVSWPTGC
jgi:Flp pilus assembly protein TadG